MGETKTIYVIEYPYDGIGDAYSTIQEARNAVLREYLHDKMSNGITLNADYICEDITSLINENYIEEYAYINTVTLHI